MRITSLSARPIADRRFRPQPSSPGKILSTLCSAAIAVAMAVGSALPAQAGPFLDIGKVSTFKAGPTTNPGGPWTLGDKDFTWLADSGNWNQNEDIQLQLNANPGIFSHQFLISNLSDYDAPITLQLDYKVHINGADGPSWSFFDIFLDSTVSGKTVEVWKDVFDSEAGYLAQTGYGGTTGPGQWHLSSLNGVPDSAVFPAGLTDLWVRDTIKLSGVGGQVASVNNTFRQTNVPEIDPNSCASALGIVMGALSLLERRARRLFRVPAVA